MTTTITDADVDIVRQKAIEDPRTVYIHLPTSVIFIGHIELHQAKRSVAYAAWFKEECVGALIQKPNFIEVWRNGFQVGEYHTMQQAANALYEVCK